MICCNYRSITYNWIVRIIVTCWIFFTWIYWIHWIYWRIITDSPFNFLNWISLWIICTHLNKFYSITSLILNIFNGSFSVKFSTKIVHTIDCMMLLHSLIMKRFLRTIKICSNTFDYSFQLIHSTHNPIVEWELYNDKFNSKYTKKKRNFHTNLLVFV